MPESTHVSRRSILAAAAAFVVPAAFAREQQETSSKALNALEARAGGRLGVCILSTHSGRHAGHRMDERFAMCSTFKLPLAALVLREADAGRLRLDEVIRYSKKDLVMHAPVTEPNLAKGGMPIGALAEAAQVTSDNVAANLLLKRLGGPAGFTGMLRSIGDHTTRLDRIDPGEVHDTTTPRAMATTVAKFLSGDLLTEPSRDRLIEWMIATKTGDKRIRAGLPATWRAGDKTGTFTSAKTTNINDVAIAWPPGKAAIVVAAYFESGSLSAEMRDRNQAVLAEVGRIAARASEIS
jgi:beta-lactamase class A